MKKRYLFLAIFMFSIPAAFAQPGTVLQTLNSPTSSLADLAWDGTYLYLLGLADHNIYQIDPENGNVLGTVSTGISGALGLTFKDGYFWVSVVSDHTLKKLDANGNVIQSLPIPAAQNIGIEWDGSAFRIADSGAPDEKILTVDTSGVLQSFFLFPGDSPFGLTWDGNTIWCANNQGTGGVATIYQFDPETGAVLTSFPCPNSGSAANGLAWDGQHLWIADQTNHLIYRVEGNPIITNPYGAAAGRITDALTGWGIGAIPLFDTQTDTGGYFFADSLNPGVYGVTIAAAGFQTIVAQVEVQANDTAAVNIPLDPIGGPLDIVLTETDGDEWRLRAYRDTSWNGYEIPLGRFRGTGINFLDTPVFQFTIEPIGGGGIHTMEVADWIDNIFLGDVLIDDFEDQNISDWEIIIALNGSYLETEFIASPLLPNSVALKLRHGNFMGASFAGWMTKTFSIWIPLTPQDSVRFVLGGTPPYPLVDIAEPPSLLPQGFVLEQNYPNPFNPKTAISYQLSPTGQAAASRVELAVYNLLGQKVRTLVQARQPAGRYEVTWDGRDDTGREVGSGVYIYRLRAGDPSTGSPQAGSGHGFVQSRKMLLLR